MRLTIIAGSHRLASQSGKVARFISNMVAQNLPDFSAEILDLSLVQLPLWQEDPQHLSNAARPPEWEPVSLGLAASDALVVVVPEWSGMAPPSLKNLLLCCDRNELAHKAALLVGVSSGFGGAYPLAELRANSSKDTKICYIPESVIVRKVVQHLNDAVPQHQSDQGLHLRLLYSLRVLSEYARALITVRNSGAIDVVAFPYGM
jgi:NAD(P)H-dependent FMN reductase